MRKKTNVPAIYFHFLQTGFTLKDRTRLKNFVARLFTREGKALLSLNYIFCSDAHLLKINQDYLNHDYYTDIITFELSETPETIGEIYISIDRVRDNARQLNVSFNNELHRVIFHGALHLCGFRDKKPADALIMRTKEDEYLQKYLF